MRRLIRSRGLERGSRKAVDSFQRLKSEANGLLAKYVQLKSGDPELTSLLENRFPGEMGKMSQRLMLLDHVKVGKQPLLSGSLAGPVVVTGLGVGVNLGKGKLHVARGQGSPKCQV